MNTLNNLFNNTPIYWINLYDSLDRYNKMTQQLKDYPYTLRIEAIDGRDPIKFNSYYNLSYPPTEYSSAIIAVICSHIKAVKIAYDNGLEKTCIIEDDANFELVPHYSHTISEIISKTPTDWDIIQLYFTNNLDNVIHSYLTKGLQLFKRYDNFSATCYLINRRGMEKLLNYVSTDGEKKFHFKTDIIDPETFIFSKLNCYVLNLPFMYYYSDNMTFENYTIHPNNDKKGCQLLHLQGKNILTDFYDKYIKKNVAQNIGYTLPPIVNYNILDNNYQEQLQKYHYSVPGCLIQ